MDEILIEEKKYISSKQAAKITGYAKDYIGQLCREGRVPARLVGRAWYVLESAISDHRFGDVKTTSRESDNVINDWQTPRYETAPVENDIPTVNLHTDQPMKPESSLQDSWREWFDQISLQQDTGNSQISPNENAQDVSYEPNEDVTIAVEPESNNEEHEENVPEMQVATYVMANESVSVSKDVASKGSYLALRAVAISFACLMAVLAIFGSGYVDKITANTYVHMLAGIVTYNK